MTQAASDQGPMNLFIPITKIDEARRIVYGTLTHAVADKSGEIIDYPSTKAAYQKWSDATHERSKGKSKGNLRAMHGNVAAGKFTDIVFDDANEKIEGAAYVSDDNEWKKCLDGTYTGFSHGGSYAERWADPDNPALKRYTPELAEISLVDNPCVPTATFEFIKQDGSTELRKFTTPSPQDPVTKYSDDQARDEHGRFAGGGSSGGKSEQEMRDHHAQREEHHGVQSRSHELKPKERGDHFAAALAHKEARLSIGTPSYSEKADAARTATDRAWGVATKKSTDADDIRKFTTHEVPMTDTTDTTGAAAPAATDTTARPQDKGGVSQVWQASDGTTHLTKADALQRNVEIEAEAVAAPALLALKKLDESITKAEQAAEAAEPTSEPPATPDGDSDPAVPEAPAQEPPAPEAEPAATDTTTTAVNKGMSAVSGFAQLLQAVQFLQQDSQWEAECEGDDSELPAKLNAWLADGGSLLVQMVGEETAELTAAKAATGDLAKKGAAISAATKRHIEAMHKSAADHMGVMDNCVKALGLGDDAAEKQHTGDAKQATAASAADDAVFAERDALKKTLGDLAPQLDALAKRVQELEAQPMPPRGVLRAVAKGEDGGNVSDGDARTNARELLKGLSPEEVNMVLMKSALSKPMTNK